MRRIVVLLTLSLSFLAPLVISAAEAAETGTVQAQNTDCRRRRAKKEKSESKPKKKDKEGKKPYGFEL
jgi:Ni/Co efflux regulator RcnB